MLTDERAGEYCGGGTACRSLDCVSIFAQNAADALAAPQVVRAMDVMLLPRSPIIFRVAEVQADPVWLNALLGIYTNFVNLLDYAAIAVPAGFRVSGLPAGVTLIPLA